MRVAITGCGRGGTSMTIEIFAGSSKLDSPNMVDKKVMKSLNFPNNTVTKIPETWSWEFPQLKKLMDKYSDLKIIWSVRDPRDIIMSKMRRGVNGPEGDGAADDASPKAAVNDVIKMMKIYKEVKAEYPNRLYLVKMEDTILNFEETIGNACKFLEIPYEDEMKNFYKRMRNDKKKKRYKTIDTNEVSKWKDWKNSYGGFFTGRNINLDKLFEQLKDVVEYFDYE